MNWQAIAYAIGLEITLEPIVYDPQTAQLWAEMFKRMANYRSGE